MKSLRLRVALWFAVSVAAVMAVFVAVTFTHLRHELRLEKRERAPAGRAAWTLHGSYTETEVADIVGELWSLSLLYAAPVLLLAMGAGYFVARRALQPVQDIKEQLRRIGAPNLSARVNVADADREFRDIGHHINALLGRLEDSFRQLSDFSAQVAHELRTPLTLMRLKVEESADRIEPALAESLQEELTRLSDYVDQCLLLATAEQGRLTLRRERIPLGALVADLVEDYARLAAEQQRTITKNLAAAEVETDPRQLRQLLHILLSNAVRHGEGPISVTVAFQTDGSVTCEIVNRVAPQRPASGHGLGLRIGKALAHALGVSWQVGAGDNHEYRAVLGFARIPTSAALEQVEQSYAGTRNGLL